MLTLYIHVADQLKTSNEMNVYETIFQSKEQLNNVCKLRQPIIFYYDNFPEFKREYLIDKYGSQTILIKNVDSNDQIPFKLKEAISLIDKDTTGSYYIEKNSDLIELKLRERIEKYETNLRPIFTGKSIYDILIGSNESNTPFKYEINYRNYFLVTEGSIRIKLAPPKSEYYLDPQIDYETLDITSLINVWKTPNIDNVEIIDIVANEGQMIQIPPYWWYSIQFEKDASVLSLKYRTYMNTITIIPQIFMQILQLQNVEPILIKNDSEKCIKKNKDKESSKSLKLSKSDNNNNNNNNCGKKKREKKQKKKTNNNSN
jgi:hypothetical protein